MIFIFSLQSFTKTFLKTTLFINGIHVELPPFFPCFSFNTTKLIFVCSMYPLVRGVHSVRQKWIENFEGRKKKYENFSWCIYTYRVYNMGNVSISIKLCTHNMFILSYLALSVNFTCSLWQVREIILNSDKLHTYQ